MKQGEHAHAALRGWGWLSWGAAALGLMLKLGAWWVTDSYGLLADAGESTIDVLASTLLVVSLGISRRPADARHPWGHGKVEYFSAGVHGALTSAAGVALVVLALRQLAAADFRALELAAGLGLSAAATASNLTIALLLIRAGRTHNSPALVADGRHNLADVWTTVASWIGLGLAAATGWWMLDPLVAGLVGLNVLRIGVSIVRSAVDGLMDAAVPAAELERLRALIRGELDPSVDFANLRARRASHHTFVEFDLVVDGERTVHSSHALCDALERAIELEFAPVDVSIHVEPASEYEVQHQHEHEHEHEHAIAPTQHPPHPS